LIRSLKSDERAVCMLSAAGEHSIDDTDASGYSLFKQLLERDNTKFARNASAGGADESKSVAIGQAPVAASLEVPKKLARCCNRGAEK